MNFCTNEGMKEFFFALLLFPIFLFGYSEYVDSNLNKAWDLYKKDLPKQAAEFLTPFIESYETPDLEKLHYLNARSMFYGKAGMGKECKKDLDTIKEMCISSPECDMEMWKYYECSFAI